MASSSPSSTYNPAEHFGFSTTSQLIPIPSASTLSDRLKYLGALNRQSKWSVDAGGASASRRGSNRLLSSVSADYGNTTDSTLDGPLPTSREKATLTFPSDPAFWQALLKAVESDTATSQVPPLYILNEGTTGESLYVNQTFAHAFVESWEDNSIHSITVQPLGTIGTGGGLGKEGANGLLRTFRAPSEFWNFLVDFTERLPPLENAVANDSFGAQSSTGPGGSAPASAKSMWESSRLLLLVKTDKPLIVNVDSPLFPTSPTASTFKAGASTAGQRDRHASSRPSNGSGAGGSTTKVVGEVRLTAKEWSEAVEKWEDSRMEKDQEMTSRRRMMQRRQRDSQMGQAPSNGPGQPAGNSTSLGQGNAAGQNDRGEELSGDLPSRQRAYAVIDPLTTLPSKDEQLEPWIHTNRPGRSRYYTHFMKHWRVLEAAYRNYV
jgi:hypothetical protein